MSQAALAGIVASRESGKRTIYLYLLVNKANAITILFHGYKVLVRLLIQTVEEC